jgi:hypothetical protein
MLALSAEGAVKGALGVATGGFGHRPSHSRVPKRSGRASFRHDSQILRRKVFKK